MKAAWVGNLQRSLNEVGYSLTPDDDLGPQTFGALFKYMAKPGADAAELGRGAAEFFPSYQITTQLRIAHWFAQFGHESGGFCRMEENLNYSAGRLCAVWPRRFPMVGDASPYANNPERLAEKVYGGRMGNIHPGDGWKYRGRGPGLTGFDNYAAMEKRTGLALIDHPELAALPRNFVRIAADFWDQAACNPLADADKLGEITQRINGGRIGLEERAKLLGRIERVLM